MESLTNIKNSEKFHGKPGEDALSHVISLEDKMTHPDFPDRNTDPANFNLMALRLFRMSLFGNARLQYRGLDFQYTTWEEIREIFLNTYNNIGETTADFENAWSEL